MGFDSNLFKPKDKQEAKQKLGLESKIKYILFAGQLLSAGETLLIS